MSLTVRSADGNEEAFQDSWSTDYSVRREHSYEVTDDGSLILLLNRVHAKEHERDETQEIGRLPAGAWEGVRYPLWGGGDSSPYCWCDGAPYPHDPVQIRVRLRDGREDVFRDNMYGAQVSEDELLLSFYRHSYLVREDKSLVINRDEFDLEGEFVTGVEAGRYAADGWTGVRRENHSWAWHE